MAEDTTTQQPISDDQELAKVLAGVSGQADAAAAVDDSTLPTPMPTPADDTPALEATPAVDTPDTTLVPDLAPIAAAPQMPQATGELDSIKLEALQELRPLVDKLNVSPEEKFDTYLLLLRSTDDKALIEPAHEAARGITDETRRAQALLDIIKEIDFLSQAQ